MGTSAVADREAMLDALTQMETLIHATALTLTVDEVAELDRVSAV